MDTRLTIINQFYDQGGEEERLSRSRQGQLEFLTTMRYIHRWSGHKMNILEIGAGTGRYSRALAQEGHNVTAIELVESNLEVLRRYAAAANIAAYQGDALDLSRFPDETFDLTLLLGPMYHLYTSSDQHRALDEAIRVTKSGGVLMVSFLSVYAIMSNNYLRGNFYAGLEENFTSEYLVKHFPEQLFTGFTVTEFEQLFEHKPVKWLTTVATDGCMELAEGRRDFALSDEEFEAYTAYHWQTCEVRELLGASSHLLYIGQKNHTAIDCHFPL